MKKPNSLPKDIVNLLLPRLKDEFTAFYFYRSAKNWCKGNGFNKAADYFEKESNDELSHANKIENFLVDWNVVPELPIITSPILSFKSLADVIEKAYEIEYELYEEYEDTSIKIFKAGDICAFDLLQFFRQTQTDSVKEYSDMLNILEGIDINNKFEMILLEKKLF